jgi:hypothetical protein
MDIKVGNKVEVIDRWNSIKAKVGDIGIVMKVEETTPYKDEWGGDWLITLVTLDNRTYTLLHNQLKIIED